MATPSVERHLLTIREGHSETTYVLDASAYSIGRDPNCAIVLGAKSISRRHAILLRTPTPTGGYRYRIIDGDAQGRPSANGIQVNHQTCKERQLEHNDHIVFGGVDEVEAQYRVEISSEVLSSSGNPGLRVAQFRSLKKQDGESLPTIAGDDVVFETGFITQIHEEENDGKITVQLADQTQVIAPIHMPQVLATLRVGDRVNVTKFEGQYMFLGKLEAPPPQPPEHTAPKLPARPTHLTRSMPRSAPQSSPEPDKPLVLEPPLVPTLQGQGATLPADLKVKIEQQVQLYRRCYEAVIREMGDLQLKEECYLTIAGQILASLNLSDLQLTGLAQDAKEKAKENEA
ncbi:MAG: FHA domain-containing protein [Prochlorotrichaceae cyanobacterium]|jgi:pSer/pThr/pTyr-binding forkhead associated (FHA) protein